MPRRADHGRDVNVMKLITALLALLLSGVPIDQVAVLLGHSSVKITEKHYSPWVKARQDQLEEAVRKAW